MSANIFTSLSWLPEAPADFRAQCKRLLDAGDAAGRQARALASTRLEALDLDRLGRALTGCRASGATLAPLSTLRLGMVGTGTLDLMRPALVASAARHGVALDCVLGHYDQAFQELMSPNSAIYASDLDAILLAIDDRSLPMKAVVGEKDAAEAMVEACATLIEQACAAVRQHSRAICIIQTLARPPEALFGSLDRAIPGTMHWLVDAMNSRLTDLAGRSGAVLLDVASLAERVGLAEWHSPAEWTLAKLPFASACVPLYADAVGRLLGALRGKARKCLILDLDNTVWGGVIGDDGLEGIRIAQGDAVGEAHRLVQAAALALRDRGIVLAVSSKNTDEIARRPFREHPEMLLREEHITVFQANWNDKATNIRAIATELNLGLDAMVFLDDNPVERDLVRRMLPEVAVPELPADPALYARTLAAAGYFEAVSFSAEDRLRASAYDDNARRVALQRQVGDLGSYLRSLDMTITFSSFDAIGRERIAQLINKSNQFNLTTRRYTSAQLIELEADPDVFTLQIRLVDKFGDNGMIAVVICRRTAPAEWDIDTWLMSCRVLGREVEKATLQEVAGQAQRSGIGRLTGRWIPTDKNGLVRDHYAKLGFAALGQETDGTTLWAIEIDAIDEAPPPMVVKRVGLPDPHETGIAALIGSMAVDGGPLVGPNGRHMMARIGSLP